jgi:NADPH:quinone reductase-like Zn-dependent oxidoreductase
VRRAAGVKAVVYDRYGSPDVLRVEDVAMPIPAAGQVRVEVAATSINLSDWECLRGSPAYARIGGLRIPARRTLGSDIAGVVDAIGPGVTRFRPGDEVYGDNLGMKGGFAQYALAPEAALARKPTQLTFAEASTIPQAGAIAWQGTRRAVPGGRVLINGAGGGSGSFAIQLAKRLGAHVTGVDNAAKQDFMLSVGADEVIDYGREDVTRAARPYDLILDLAAGRSVLAYRRALAAGGTYWCVGGSVRALLRVLAVGPVVGRPTHRSIGVLTVKEGPAHFGPVADLCVTGEVGIHIDSTVTLEGLPDSLARVGEGRALGKVVVHVSRAHGVVPRWL